MNKINCIFCKKKEERNNSYIFKLKFKNKIYDYYKCAKCKIYYVNPIPSNDDLKNIYNQDYYSSFYMKETKEDNDFLRFYNKIKKYINFNDKILDYGCGDGKFLKILNDKKYNIYGADLPTNILENLIKKKLNIIPFQNLLKFENEFQLIYLRDVFEHSHNPIKLIDDLDKLLINKGYLIIDGPVEKNFSIINFLIILNYKFKKLFNNNVYENPPYHLSLYSKKQLIEFIKNKKDNLDIEDFELYETGWPLEGKGLIKNIIAKISIIISKIFFLKKIYGNRLLLVLKKNEKEE